MGIMTASRTTYLYRLIVTKPDGSSSRYWQPEAWEEICAEKGWNPNHFEWPTRVTYLSRDSAHRRAAFLRRLGAAVEVVRSQPVRWSEDEPGGSLEYRVRWQREGQDKKRALFQTEEGAVRHAERQKTAAVEMEWLETPLAELVVDPVVESRAVGSWKPHE